MKKYKVKRITDSRTLPDRTENEQYITFALELKDQYGLPFSISEIIETWRDVSACYAAGWLIPHKTMVEDAFGVELEEIIENE